MFKEYFTNYRNASDMYKKLREAEGEWNEEQKVFSKMKKVVKNVSENKKFEQGKRSGVGYINKRYSKANNEYCKDYNKKKKKLTLLDILFTLIN